MSRRPHVCFDRILPRDLMRPQATEPGRPGRTRAISPIGKTWMNGSTLRVRFIGGSAAQRAKVEEQAGWWTAVANLNFDFDDAPNADIRISFDANDGAWSYIGTDCRSIPLNEATMNLGFLDGGTDGARVRPRHRAGARAPEPGRRHPVERGGRDPRDGRLAQLLGRGDDAPQHPVALPRRPGQRHQLRPRVDHAVLLPGRLDDQRHRHQGQRSPVAAWTSSSSPAPRCTRRPRRRSTPPPRWRSTRGGARRRRSASSARKTCSASTPTAPAATRSTPAARPTW